MEQAIISSSSDSNSSDWNETKLLLQELEQLFSKEDDLQDIVDIKKIEREIQIQCELQNNTAKELIKAMSTLIKKKEEEVLAPSQSEHINTLQRLSENEQLSSQQQAVLNAIDNKKKHISKVTNNIQTIQEKAKEFTISATMADSRTAHAISLYGKISNITWDYNAPAGHLVGWIGNDSKKELQGFDVDTKGLSSFDITNKLWELIENNM